MLSFYFLTLLPSLEIKLETLVVTFNNITSGQLFVARLWTAISHFNHQNKFLSYCEDIENCINTLKTELWPNNGLLDGELFYRNSYHTNLYIYINNKKPYLEELSQNQAKRQFLYKFSFKTGNIIIYLDTIFIAQNF